MKTEMRISYLTLMELVICLGILAAVASVTLGMLEDSSEKNRCERTYETGSRIREVINAEKSADGVSRFVSDMGRLPVVASTDDGKLLVELFDKTMVDAGIQWSTGTNFVNDNGSLPAGDSVLSFPDDFRTLNLPCGWNGPYMLNSRSTLFDGWGRNWLVVKADGSATDSPVLNEFIYGVESFGSDGDNTDDSWSAVNQEFKFNTSGVTAANNAELIVTIMVRDASASIPVMRMATQPPEGNTYASWTANQKYSVGDVIAKDGFLFRCKKLLISTKGRSGTSVSGWNTTEPVSAEGGKITTADRGVIWEYIGAGDGSEPNWVAGFLYARHDIIHVGSNAFACIRIEPLSGSSEPSFPKTYGSTVQDGDVIWECVYPEPFRMNRLRVAYFSPCVTSTGKGIKRLLTKCDNSTTETNLVTNFTVIPATFFDSMAQEQAAWLSGNQVRLSNLTPGTRKLYAYGYFRASDGTLTNRYGSDVAEVTLKPGVNRITVFLTNEL